MVGTSSDCKKSHNVPSTRYRGSKLKLTQWIWETIKHIKFQSALDAFGGTASVSYFLKLRGKKVTYNDILSFNYHVGNALVANSRVKLSDDDVTFLLRKHSYVTYQNVIAATFNRIYFTKKENEWLDVVAQNIPHLRGRFKRSLAYFALFQSCLIKRPYNLFHRKNLYMRHAKVQRSFGNKTTWDQPFEVHFRRFVSEVNRAIFYNGAECQALSCDALNVPGKYDLVYLDTPYISPNRVADNYLDLYHFLEGLTNYQTWQTRIDYSKKHRPIANPGSRINTDTEILRFFRQLLEHFADSTIVVSYRSDGFPSKEQLTSLLLEVKRSVTMSSFGTYKYALSSNGHSKEILLIGK
jgi:adenine-specific DNA methylase